MSRECRRGFLRDILATAGTLLAAWWTAGPRPLKRAQAGTSAPLRPPGALDEPEFLSRCIRCLRCMQACPNQAILPLDESYGSGRASTPVIFARRQACMLCSKIPGDTLQCTAACPSGALRRTRKDTEEIARTVAMGKAHIDQALCYSFTGFTCGACYRACPFPERAMRIGLWERPEILADGCIGCGLCERACIRYPQAVRVTPRRSSCEV